MSTPPAGFREALAQAWRLLRQRQPSLNIGIYGYTRAGKTQFLFNLLKYWRDRNELECPNRTCEAFLRQVELTKDPSGAPDPTSPEKQWDAIEFVWSEQPSKKETRYYPIAIRDLCGERLDEYAREGAPGENPLAGLIRECDSFLFLFNPTEKEDRDTEEDHVRIELERVEFLLEAMLQGRGPILRRGMGMRPIVFLITAKD